uniref:Uncharacterized protein n=1 Tax=Romanomermis culicivorax TaxID=13658 RepID=A0A915KRY7_ROMCU
MQKITSGLHSDKNTRNPTQTRPEAKPATKRPVIMKRRKFSDRAPKTENPIAELPAICRKLAKINNVLLRPNFSIAQQAFNEPKAAPACHKAKVEATKASTLKFCAKSSSKVSFFEKSNFRPVSKEPLTIPAKIWWATFKTL